jgi:predicted dehydrogenase
MHEQRLSRRRDFLKTAASAATALAMPSFIPAAALGKDGAAPPSEQITMGAIGIGARGSYDIGCFLEQPDARFVANCDVREERRNGVKQRIDKYYGTRDCTAYRDFRDLLARPDIDAVLITTGSNWHALLSIFAAKAGKDVYCEKPCSKTIVESLALADAFRRTARVFQGGMQRRSLPGFQFAGELARQGKLGKLHTLHAHPCGLTTKMSGWTAGKPEPPKEQLDWDMFLGTAAWRPFDTAHLSAEFEKGGGMTGGGCLEWGSHCVDQCQWANHADDTVPVEYFPLESDRASATYPNGVKLVLRNDGWLPLGSCPVRYEGSGGWVEVGDSGQFALSSPALLSGRKVEVVPNYPATPHIRNFLDCVKTRASTRANAQVACNTHIACHAVNIAIHLNRKLAYDPKKNEFIGDDEANRFRGEALREPWRF